MHVRIAMVTVLVGFGFGAGCTHASGPPLISAEELSPSDTATSAWMRESPQLWDDAAALPPDAPTSTEAESAPWVETLATTSEPPFEVSSGSSLRALTASTSSTNEASWLVAARCLLSADVARIEESLEAARREGAIDAGRLDAWASVLTDARALADDVAPSKPSAGLSASSPCDTPDQRSLWVRLRGLVGPSADRPTHIASYARGLRRLRAELENRAQLPSRPE